MKDLNLDLPTKILLLFMLMSLLSGLTSCCPSRCTYSKPTKREIDRAMKHSTREYKISSKSIYNTYYTIK